MVEINIVEEGQRKEDLVVFGGAEELRWQRGAYIYDTAILVVF